jgi:hypothetical protein
VTSATFFFFFFFVFFFLLFFFFLFLLFLFFLFLFLFFLFFSFFFFFFFPCFLLFCFVCFCFVCLCLFFVLLFCVSGYKRDHGSWSPKKKERMDPIGLDGTLALVIDVLSEALANLNEDRRREEDRCREERNGPEDRHREGPAGPTGKKSKKSKKSRDNRVAASDAEDEARKLNAHVSRLHRELSEQTAIATRERAMREKLDDRVASLVEEMRDMRAAHKHDLAELARAREQERLERKRAELERAELKRTEIEGQEETKEKKEKKEKKGRGKKGKERNKPSDECKEAKEPSYDEAHGHSADGREGPEDRKEPDGPEAQKEPDGPEAQKDVEEKLVGRVLTERIYDVSVRTTSAIAAMDPRELSRDDLCVMRTAMDVHCTTTVLDAHGMLCGLMHLTCPLTAMREWAESSDSIDAMAVCLVRADPLGENTRAAFTAAILRRASGTELGRAVLDRGPGKHGPVRVVTYAARRCPLAAKPDEMLAWLVRARARSALDLGI